jgi:NitT/TauT family transport system substrate-binding protein
VAGVLGVVLGALLAGCAPRSESQPAVRPVEASPTTSAAAAPVPLKVRLAATSISGSFMPVWTAHEAGLFVQEGLEVELSSTPTAPTAVAALLAGEVDMLYGASDAVIAANTNGSDVVMVGALVNKIVQALYVTPEITGPAALRGRSLGVTRFGTLGVTSSRYLLRRWGLNADQDVTFLQTGGFAETVAALSSGAIDSGILAPPATLRARELGFAELGNLWTQPLEYPSVVVTARRVTEPTQEEVIRRVLRGVMAGVHRVKTDRPLAVSVLQTWTRTEDVRAVEDTYDLYTPLFERDLRLSEEAFRTALDEHARDNPRAASAAPASLMDSRFVDQIVRSGFVDQLYAR